MPGIAIIGAGVMGRAHARAWAALGLRDEIRYVCTPQPGASLADAPLALGTSDLDAALGDPEVDLVSVCTPTDSHFELAGRALAAGKHVLLEKPITSTAEEGLRLAAIADDRRRTLMVAHVVRFYPGYEAVRRAVRQGAVGEPRLVGASRLTAVGERPAWLADERRSGGPLVDFAVHDFDQANLLLGAPRTVRSVRTGAAAFETTVEYEAGGRARVLTSMAMPEGFPFTTAIEVVGDRGTAAYRSSGGSGRYEAVGPGGAEEMQVEPGDPFVDQVRYFWTCAASGRRPELADARSAVLALRVALAAKQSLDTGALIDLPPLDG
jgi:predicted dehydrogenase